jgi:hypothetical protein
MRTCALIHVNPVPNIRHLLVAGADDIYTSMHNPRGCMQVLVDSIYMKKLQILIAFACFLPVDDHECAKCVCVEVVDF